MKPPIPPPGRIIREGCVATCEICGSSLKRRWFGLGAVIGCLQPKCWNWHGWSYLPAGRNRPIDLYGAPVKPSYVAPPPPDTFEGPFGTVRMGTCSKCHRTSHVVSQRQSLCPECFSTMAGGRDAG